MRSPIVRVQPEDREAEAIPPRAGASGRLGQFAGRLQMCGDQSCVLVGRGAVARLNGGGQLAMGLLTVDA